MLQRLHAAKESTQEPTQEVLLKSAPEQYMIPTVPQAVPLDVDSMYAWSFPAQGKGFAEIKEELEQEKMRKVSHPRLTAHQSPRDRSHARTVAS
eukprot:5567109-Prymnesium_polylepis.2